jgi:5'-methylthioadenosine phosphorylase
MQQTLGIIGGSGFLEGAGLDDAAETEVGTPQGTVTLLTGEGYAYLLRHGHGVYHPPHRIPHHAHVLAFEQLGVTHVVGLNSVGSLSVDLAPGTVVVSDDYLSAYPPPTFAEDERLHIVPTLSAELRELLLAAARTTEGELQDGGVYVETRGPRFETPAEVRWLAPHGDIIGMTAASEATLFVERGMHYAMLGVVDNLANGLDAAPLTYEAYEHQLKKNHARGHAILAEIIRLHREKEQTL